MHPKVLPDDAWAVVARLKRGGLLEGWQLAGGTGLSLQLGHRYSDDLDLFRPEPFDVEALVSSLSRIGPVTVQDRAPDTLHALVGGVRLSFLRAHPALLFAGTPYRGLVVADPRDIAVMKIVAVGGRGSRKDFVDLFVYARLVDGLSPVFALLRERFADVDYNEYHLLKSLAYFEDAEREPMPRMICDLSWAEIKGGLIREARTLAP